MSPCLKAVISYQETVGTPWHPMGEWLWYSLMDYNDCHGDWSFPSLLITCPFQLVGSTYQHDFLTANYFMDCTAHDKQYVCRTASVLGCKANVLCRASTFVANLLTNNLGTTNECTLLEKVWCLSAHVPMLATSLKVLLKVLQPL